MPQESRVDGTDAERRPLTGNEQFPNTGQSYETGATEEIKENKSTLERAKVVGGYSASAVFAALFLYHFFSALSELFSDRVEDSRLSYSMLIYRLFLAVFWGDWSLWSYNIASGNPGNSHRPTRFPETASDRHNTLDTFLTVQDALFRFPLDAQNIADIRSVLREWKSGKISLSQEEFRHVMEALRYCCDQRVDDEDVMWTHVKNAIKDRTALVLESEPEQDIEAGNVSIDMTNVDNVFELKDRVAAVLNPSEKKLSDGLNALTRADGVALVPFFKVLSIPSFALMLQQLVMLYEKIGAHGPDYTFPVGNVLGVAFTTFVFKGSVEYVNAQHRSWHQAFFGSFFTDYGKGRRDILNALSRETSALSKIDNPEELKILLKYLSRVAKGFEEAFPFSANDVNTCEALTTDFGAAVAEENTQKRQDVLSKFAALSHPMTFPFARLHPQGSDPEIYTISPE